MTMNMPILSSAEALKMETVCSSEALVSAQGFATQKTNIDKYTLETVAHLKVTARFSSGFVRRLIIDVGALVMSSLIAVRTDSKCIILKQKIKGAEFSLVTEKARRYAVLVVSFLTPFLKTFLFVHLSLS
jgi:hypothetical protein